MTDAAGYPLNWELDSLLPHPATPEFRARLDEFRRDLEATATLSDALPPVAADPQTVAKWVALLAAYERVTRLAGDFSAFIGCHAAAEAENKTFQAVEAELSALDPLRDRIAVNVEFGLRAVDESALAAFLAADPWLARNAFFLKDRRENARLRLPREQELLAADLAVDGLHAWGRLYDRLCGALRVSVMERGQVVRKSVGQVQFDSPSRAIRENNFHAADVAWQTIADPCAEALNHIAGTRLTVYRRVGLQDHLVAPLKYNRMRRETLEAMWSTVTARKGVLLEYLARKAKLFGLERLSWFDVNAPLPTGIASKQAAELPYDEACRTVVRTFTGFSGEFGEFAERALRQRWVEVENRAGKRQGGFCTGLPTAKQTRIFMTYTNSADSMSTLAHELGHAYHTWVLRDEPLFLQDYPMNLAETASTFAEAVLGEEQLRQAGTAEERLILLDALLGDAVAFLMNIHSRFLFEDAFHKERAHGEVPAARLSELMVAAQQEAYLGALAPDGWNPRFWASKLHFYISGLPFYNFPYTFGYLLSLGVYARAGDFGREFPAKYRELLLATGCRNTEEAVLGSLGEDLTKPDFWNRSLDVIEARTKQFLHAADQVAG